MTCPFAIYRESDSFKSSIRIIADTACPVLRQDERVN